MTALAIDPSEIKITDYRAIRDRLMQGGTIPRPVLAMLERREMDASRREDNASSREAAIRDEAELLTQRERLIEAAKLEISEREAVVARREAEVTAAMAKVERLEARLGRKLITEEGLPAISLPPGRRFRFKDIAGAVLKRYSVSRTDLLSQRRTHSVGDARRAICVLAREFTLLSLPEIGRLIGGKDHTTVLHHVKVARPTMLALRHMLGPEATLEEWVDALYGDLARGRT